MCRSSSLPGWRSSSIARVLDRLGYSGVDRERLGQTVTERGTMSKRARMVLVLVSCSVVAALSGCGSATASDGGGSEDVLTRLAASTQVSDVDRKVCDEGMSANPLPPGVTVTATTKAAFKDVKAAMATRIGQAKTDVTAPALSADTEVTLCALDTSTLSATPQVARIVFASGGGSTWWADGALS
jgi:hypothetical protein